MKKMSLLTAATLGTMSGTAFAQSSVSLYGIVDDGFTINTNANGKHQYYLATGALKGSRFGLRGAEDLGSGLGAIFVLESGLDINSGKAGQGGLMFGRQAYVGLSSNYGTVTMGRQYDSVVDYVGGFEAGSQWGGYVVSHPGDLDNYQNDFRTNNTVKYTSVDYNGLMFGSTYSLGGQAGNFTGNQIWSLGARYNKGPLSIGAGYLNARTPATLGGMFNNGGTATAVTTPVYSGFTSASTYQVIGAGGAYTFGAATFGVTYSNTKFLNLGAAASSAFRNGESAAFNNAEVSIKYQLTPFFLLGAEFDYTKSSSTTLANGASNAGAQYYHGSLGADYFLSKRTDLYAIATYEKASGTDSTNKPAVAAISNVTPSASNRQFVATVGIRHKF
jgi:predicted porin